MLMVVLVTEQHSGVLTVLLVQNHLSFLPLVLVSSLKLLTILEMELKDISSVSLGMKSVLVQLALVVLQKETLVVV